MSAEAAEKQSPLEFTDQRLSPQAGSATFWDWLRPSGWVELLAAALTHPAPCSNDHLPLLAKALAFCHGLLCEARKLTHEAYLQRDPLVPELLGIRRVPSRASLSRFFAGFRSAGGAPSSATTFSNRNRRHSSLGYPSLHAFLESYFQN